MHHASSRGARRPDLRHKQRSLYGVVAVRISEARLHKLMRARRIGTRSELINTLLAEEEERLRSHTLLQLTAATVRATHIDDRVR